MPTLAEVRSAIVAVMTGIAGIGQVHAFERYAKREAEFRSLFEYEDADGAKQLRGWVLRRISTTETSPGVGRYVVDHRWQIRGYMAFNDEAESELAFDALIEAIRDAFRADETLGGLVASTILAGTGAPAGVQVQDSGPVMFAGVLCHSARLALTTRHYQ